MSQENVEIVRRLVEAHDRRDYDAVFALYDPLVVYRLGGFIEGFRDVGLEPLYIGQEGVRRFWREWLMAWETVRFQYEDFIDAGDRVLIVLSARLRGKASSVELTMDSYVQLWTVRNGKVIEMEFFLTKAAALEAVGLSE
jgi:ketosteroid isomerase-like protein